MTGGTTGSAGTPATTDNADWLFIDKDQLRFSLKALSGLEMLVRRQGLELRTR